VKPEYIDRAHEGVTQAKAPSNSLNAASALPIVVSGADGGRIESLLALANSRRGLNAWDIAELARLRGIDPDAPLRVIFASPRASNDEDLRLAA
jgi:hypothetical protein